MQLTCNYSSLVNDLGYHLFGLRPTSVDLFADNVILTTSPQGQDILRCIAKGLQFVYGAYRWSFLRPVVSITTLPAYSTGAITVDSAGNVLLNGGVPPTDGGFPSYAASSGGSMNITGVGTFAVQSRSSATALVLANFTGNAVTAPASASYSLVFASNYALPVDGKGNYIDTLEGALTYPGNDSHCRETLTRVSEFEVRRLLAHSTLPHRPRVYAETTGPFDATTGSTRFVTFFPPPDVAVTLTAVGVLVPVGIDATNQYPLGGAALAPCIQESCLAAAEREIEQKDARSPDAVHNAALPAALALAIQRDKEYAAPDSLGVDHGQGDGEGYGGHPRNTSIYWNGSANSPGGYTGWL
jgi:hypothetical protein